MKEFFKKHLPSNILTPLFSLKRNFKGYNSNKPVAQFYYLDGVDCYIGINNFFSFLSPNEIMDCEIYLSFYDKDGNNILNKKMSLPDKASPFILINQLFKNEKVNSNQGIVTLQIKLKKRRDLLKFGMLSSHFFLFFLDRNNFSMSHIHPLSALDNNNQPVDKFLSSQRVFLKGLKEIKVFQMNPTIYSQEISYTFKTNLNEIYERKIQIGKNGTDIIDIDQSVLEKFKGDYFEIEITPLPSANAKPMLMRIFTDDKFSMSHS
jgi:hypothetical protein